MQPCSRIYYFKFYWRLNMFRAAYRSSSGAPNSICSLWFLYPCGDWQVPTQPGQRSVTTCLYKPEAANTVWSSWLWAVCRTKHVEPSIKFGIINSITRLHLVGCFYWFNFSSVLRNTQVCAEMCIVFEIIVNIMQLSAVWLLTTVTAHPY